MTAGTQQVLFSAKNVGLLQQASERAWASSKSADGGPQEHKFQLAPNIASREQQQENIQIQRRSFGQMVGTPR